MKIGALRQTQLPVSSAGRGRCVCLPPFIGTWGFAPDPIPGVGCQAYKKPLPGAAKGVQRGAFHLK